MTTFRKTYEKGRYDFRDAKCIEADCWAPGEYFTRGATGGSGSRNTGRSSFCCMRRAYHGCPDDIVYDIGKAQERKADGWKKTS
jgi:hypothetical protein